MLVNGDVVFGSLVTIAVAFVLFLALRLARWNELMKACMQGITDMVPMIVIVFAAYMVRDSLIAIGMPEYVISIAQPFMSPALLPVITFVICALLAFMSGTNWGLYASGGGRCHSAVRLCGRQHAHGALCGHFGRGVSRARLLIAMSPFSPLARRK